MIEKTDWKVKAILNKELIVEDILKLVAILKRQLPVSCIVSAADEDEAIAEASKRLETHMGIPMKCVKELQARRLR